MSAEKKLSSFLDKFYLLVFVYDVVVFLCYHHHVGVSSSGTQKKLRKLTCSGFGVGS